MADLAPSVRALCGKPITSLDVAYVAGVSQSTVSRALRNDTQLREETRLRVIKAARDLGYVVNACASRLRRQEKTSIAVVIIGSAAYGLDSTTQEIMRLLPALSQQIEARGCDLLLSLQQEGSFRPIALGNVRGIIVLGTAESGQAWICDNPRPCDEVSLVQWDMPDPRLTSTDLAAELVADLFVARRPSIGPGEHFDRPVRSHEPAPMFSAKSSPTRSAVKFEGSVWSWA